MVKWSKIFNFKVLANSSFTAFILVLLFPPSTILSTYTATRNVAPDEPRETKTWITSSFVEAHFLQLPIESMIPAAWGLLQPIYAALETTNQVFLPGLNESFQLSHIELSRELSTKEGGGNVHLMELKFVLSSQRYHGPH